MNDALKPNHRKQSASNRCSSNGAKDDQTKEASRVPPAFALEKELGAGYFGVHGGHIEERENE